MVSVRPHLAVWYVWKNGRHVATILHDRHARYPYVLRRATAPRTIIATCSTWSAAKTIAREHFA
jgi:hypothetical protein